MIKTYWHKVLNLGIQEDTTFSQIKKIKLVNEISILIVFVNLFTNIRWYMMGYPFLIWLNASGIFFMFLVLYCNKNHHHKYAQLIFFAYVPIHLTAQSLFIPAGFEQYIFPLMILSGFLIEKRRNFLIYISMLGLLYLFLKSELITAYYLPFDSNYLSAFTILSSFIALLFCIISINIFVKQYEMNRHEVLIVNDMLEESVKMAKEKAAYAELLLREMNHRVKNNLQLISSLLNIQAQKVNSNIAKKALGDAKNRVHSIALIHERLYLDPDIQSVDVTDYLDSLIQNIKSSLPLGVTGSLNVESHSDHYRLPFRDAVSVGLILNEMITNAILHGLKNIADKEIRVEVLGRDEGRLRLNVKDNGMNLEKAMDPKNRGFGMELIETLAGNYNGKVFVNKKMNMLVVELQFEQEEETIAV